MNPKLVRLCTWLLVWLIASGASLHAQQAVTVAVILDDVQVLGLAPAQEALARAAVPSAPGEPITEAGMDALNAELRALDLPREHLQVHLEPVVGDRRPNGARPDALHVRLILDFRSPLTLSAVRLFTLIPVDEEQFAEALTLRAGDAHQRTAIADQAEALLERARALGYDTAKVTPFEDQRTTGSVRVTYFIEDDTPPLRKSISLRHAGFLRSTQFKNALEKLPDHAIDKNTTLTAPLLIDIRELSKRFFTDQGWLDVDSNLEEVRVKTDKKDRRIARVYFGIERGERTKIHDTTVFDFDHIPAGAFDGMIREYQGRNFSRLNRDEIRKALHDICEEHGFFSPEIMISRDVQPDSKQVDLAAQVDEGTTSTLHAIHITHRPYPRDPGFLSRLVNPVRRHVAPRVGDEVIGRQITAQLGEQLERSLIRESELNLHGMGIFDKIKLDTLPTSDPLQRDLIVDVEDKLTAALTLTAGWSDTAGLLGGVGFVERNMFGVGDQLSVSTQFSELDWRGQVSYLDRNWKLGDRILGERRAPSLTYTGFFQDGFYDEYVEQHLGGLISLSYRRLNAPIWRDVWQLRAEQIQFDPDRDRSDYEEDFDDYVAGSLAYYLLHDTRKFADWSREGHAFRTGLELGSADGFLARWSTHYDLYIPITKRLGWVTRTQLEMLPTPARDVGLADRLQGGGTYDMRGFENRGIGPVDPMVNSLRTGGATKLLVQNELRFRFHEHAMVLGFVDAATLSETAFSFNSWRLSVGVGGRVKIPQINSEIFLYFTEPLHSQDIDDETSVHFGVRFVF